MQLDGIAHTVKQGETLWSIANDKLGGGDQWPRIYSFTNSKHCQSLGASRISDPDFLTPGMIIRLPLVPGVPTPKSGTQDDCPPANYSMQDEGKKKTKSTTFGYDLEDSPPVIFMGPGYKATIKLKGTLILSAKHKAPLAYVGNSGLTAKREMEADAIIAQLIAAQSFSFDPKTNKMTYKNMLIVRSHYAFVPKFAIGSKMDFTDFTPKIFGEIYYPKLQGEIQDWAFIVAKFKISIEVEPSTFPGTNPTDQKPGDNMVPYTPAPQYDPTKDWVLMTAYVVAAGIITATIIEDFLTLGAGVADDPASLALAEMIILAARSGHAARIAPVMMSL